MTENSWFFHHQHQCRQPLVFSVAWHKKYIAIYLIQQDMSSQPPPPPHSLVLPGYRFKSVTCKPGNLPANLSKPQHWAYILRPFRHSSDCYYNYQLYWESETTIWYGDWDQWLVSGEIWSNYTSPHGWPLFYSYVLTNKQAEKHYQNYWLPQWA